MLSRSRYYTGENFVESFLSGLKLEIAHTIYLIKPTTMKLEAIDIKLYMHAMSGTCVV